MTAAERARLGILEDVLDNPEDDTPRLVYADWCDEHGEPGRAEFIRAQVGVARHEAELARRHPDQDLCTEVCASWCPVCGDCCCPDPESSMDWPACPLHAPTSRHNSDESLRAVAAELASRAVALFHTADSWAWCDVAGMRFNHACVDKPEMRSRDHPWAVFRRGFVERVEMTLTDYDRHAGAVFASYPVREVALTDVSPIEIAGVWNWMRNKPEPQSPWFLPDSLWRLLDLPLVAVVANNAKSSPTRERAALALSRACRVWGRRRAEPIRKARLSAA